jgi:hypothetical protein
MVFVADVFVVVVDVDDAVVVVVDFDVDATTVDGALANVKYAV